MSAQRLFKNVPTIRAGIAQLIQKIKYIELSKEIVHQTKRCALDFIGVALAGTRIGLSPTITSIMKHQGGLKESSPIGEKDRMPAQAAAFVTAVKGHVLDMDDGHRQANLHPGVGTIPAAVAVGEMVNSDGCALIEALIAGYEVMIRLGIAVSPDHLLSGFHTTSTVGPFASAAASARLLQLDEEQTAEALSLAGLQSGGLLEALSSGQMSKPFQVGCASQSGVLAAKLAAEGVVGPREIFEGEKGFFKAFVGRDCGSGLFEWPDDPDQIMTGYFKRHAACRHVHAALDSIASLAMEEELQNTEIEHIEVETYSIALRLAGQHTGSSSGIAAKFSLPVSIGLLLTFGRVDADIYTDENVARPEVQDVADKVSVSANPERDRVYPAERSARVMIKARGRRFSSEVKLPKGDPEFPFSDEELIEKFRRNAGVVLSLDEIDRLEALIWDLENHSIEELVNSMIPGSTTKDFGGKINFVT